MYGGIGATSNPDGPYAAVNVAWKTLAALPLPAGPRQFHVVLPFINVRDDSTPPPNADAVGWNPWHRYPGPWTFDFEMNVDGGTTVTPDAVADSGGVRVQVSRLIAASSIVRGRVLPFVATSVEPDGTFALLTDGGVDNSSGAWTVTIRAGQGGPGRPTLRPMGSSVRRPIVSG